MQSPQHIWTLSCLWRHSGTKATSSSLPWSTKPANIYMFLTTEETRGPPGHQTWNPPAAKQKCTTTLVQVKDLSTLCYQQKILSLDFQQSSLKSRCCNHKPQKAFFNLKLKSTRFEYFYKRTGKMDINLYLSSPFHFYCFTNTWSPLLLWVKDSSRIIYKCDREITTDVIVAKTISAKI